MKRIKTFVAVAVLAVAAMLTSFSDRNQTFASGDFTCKLSATCPGIAQCSGDRWTRTGDCSISCYRDAGAPGEIVFNGSANCGTGAGGRATGDSPGSL